MNFEDFLVMHCADETLNYWIERCAELRKGLGSDILSSKEYLPAFLKLFPKYQKGVIPIEINPESLELCFRRHSDPAVPLKNDFAGYLMSLLELGELVYK
ncbi:MAG: hypothetical protein IJ228_07970 [Succinivibrio sp.]|nr:hypothetical protein [Succinivibrio sp.]